MARGQNRSAGIGGVEGIIANAPGATTTGTLANNINNSVYQNILSTRAIGLGDISRSFPCRPISSRPAPRCRSMAVLSPPGVRSEIADALHAEHQLSVTRLINRKFTVDVRYTGTLGRKQVGSIDINQNNVYTNPELFQALTDTRAATCTAIHRRTNPIRIRESIPAMSMAIPSFWINCWRA